MSALPRSVFVPYNLRMVIRIASLLVLCLLTGCSYVNTTYQWMGGFATGMDVSSVSVDPVHVSTEYTTAVCAVDTSVEGALWLTDIPIADLVAGTVDSGQILHIELLWLPRPGYPPIDYEATNISIRYIVISDGEYGIYEGGGFGYPLGTPEDSSMVLNIESATLQLAKSTSGFVDLLSPAVLSGTFNGPCDRNTAILVRDATSQLVTNAFDKTMYVQR